MGRTGDSLHLEFPPRSGGGCPLQEKPLVGRTRPMEWDKVIVVVVVVAVVVTIITTTILSMGHPPRFGPSAVFTR